MFGGAFTDFVATLEDFVHTLLEVDYAQNVLIYSVAGPIMAVVGIVLALAAWRIIS